jgi:hypothetical protein
MDTLKVKNACITLVITPFHSKIHGPYNIKFGVNCCVWKIAAWKNVQYIKFASALGAYVTFNFKNAKQKLLKVNAAVWFIKNIQKP